MAVVRPQKAARGRCGGSTPIAAEDGGRKLHMAPPGPQRPWPLWWLAAAIVATAGPQCSLQSGVDGWYLGSVTESQGFVTARYEMETKTLLRERHIS